VVAASPSDQRKLNLDSFEFIWTTIHDQYWDPTFGGLNWQAVHDELRPRMEHASTMVEARHVMREMIGRLGKSHFGIIPADVYPDLGEREEGGGPATTGIDVRVLAGKAIVTTVDDGSSAAALGVHSGWEVLNVDGVAVGPALRRITEVDHDSTMLDIHLARSVKAKLSGTDGSRARIEFDDGSGRHVTKPIERSEPPGSLARFGYLPPLHVWFQARKIASNVGYLTFNRRISCLSLATRSNRARIAQVSLSICAGIRVDSALWRREWPAGSSTSPTSGWARCTCGKRRSNSR